MGEPVSASEVSAASPSSGLDWEETRCPLCDSRQWSTLLKALDAGGNAHRPRPAVVQCRDCGLCFTNPHPSPAAMHRFYPADYAPHRARTSPAGWRTAWWSRFLARLPGRSPDRRTLPKSGECRLLDFGCGSGSYLRRMHAQGWHVLGLDVSPAAVDRVRRELGLPALVGTLPHPQLAPASFEVVTMWQSLEHVHRPLEAMQHAWELLVPGGTLIVAVPNIESGPFRWFGSSWYGLELPRHLIHFSPRTLQRMAERAGFHVVAVRMAWHSSWLQTSARRARRHGHRSRWLRWLSLRSLCRLVGWYCVLARQSDCIVLSATKPATPNRAVGKPLVRPRSPASPPR